MTTYDLRKHAGNEAEKLVASFLASHTASCQHRSPESYIPRLATWHLKAVIEMLERSDEEVHREWATSLKHYRYTPDYEVIDLDADLGNGERLHVDHAFVDAKASKWVEREAFEHYQRLEASGTPVFLAVVLPAMPTTILWTRANQLVLDGNEWATPERGSGTPCKTMNFWKSGTIEIELPLGKETN